jgi:hypothetical protein
VFVSFHLKIVNPGLKKTRRKSFDDKMSRRIFNLRSVSNQQKNTNTNKLKYKVHVVIVTNSDFNDRVYFLEFRHIISYNRNSIFNGNS